MKRNNIYKIICVALLVSTNIGLCQNLQEMPAYFSSSRTIIDPNTDVTINIIVDGTKIIYKIGTPAIDDIDFVLALDSSGNFGLGGDEHRIKEKTVLSAVPKFLDGINSSYSDMNIKMSIISWDENIDFAYSGFENKNPFNAKLVPVKTALNDVKDLHNYYICDENEYSNLSIPIKASLEIFKLLPAAKYKRTSRSIILVTGNGVFKNCSDDLIRESIKKDFQIYVIGLDIYPSSKIYEQLMRLVNYDPERIQIIPSGSGLLESMNLIPSILETALNSTLERILIKNDPMFPVARDIRITQTLDCYLDPVSIKVNGIGVRFNKIVNPDGTITITFELPAGLMAKSDTEVAIDTRPNINKLPEYTENGFNPIIPTLDSSLGYIYPSYMTYTWLNGEKFSIDLPSKPFIPPLYN